MHEKPLDTIRALTAAWIRKDKEGMAQWLARNVTEIGPAFPSPLLGRRGLLDKYHEYFCGRLEILSYRILRPKTIRLSERFALVYFVYRMTTRTNNRLEQSHGKESILLERKRGRWFVSFIHWHRDPDSAK